MFFPKAFFDPVHTEERKIEFWGATPQKGDRILTLNEHYFSSSESDTFETGVFEWNITNGNDLGYSWGLKTFLVRNGTLIETPHYTIKISRIFFFWKATFRKK